MPAPARPANRQTPRRPCADKIHSPCAAQPSTKDGRVARRMIALLIRHADTAAIGQVLWGRKPGLSLSDAGTAQARRLATRLRWVPLAAIYASPRERAQQTARPLALVHRLPIVEAGELDEVDFGDWSGLRFEELDARPTGGASIPIGLQRTPPTASASPASSRASCRSCHGSRRSTGMTRWPLSVMRK